MLCPDVLSIELVIVFFSHVEAIILVKLIQTNRPLDSIARAEIIKFCEPFFTF